MTSPDPWSELRSAADAASRYPHLYVTSTETACLLNLLERVEALERLSGATTPRSQTTSPLLSEVTALITQDGEVARWDDASTLLRQIAAWLRKRGGWTQVTVADLLEREASR